MASEHYINSYRDLALNAIEDLKNYANDERPERRIVSYREYTKDLERLDSTRPAPVATDTGLVTVAKVDSRLGDMSRLLIIDRPLSIGTEVCLRSQAEELLAAERSEKKDLIREWAEACYIRDADIRSLKELNRLHVSANAAQAARIKELEADRDHQSKLSNKLNRSHAVLEAKLAAAQKALEGIDSIITDSIHENGSDQHRMKIGDKWYVGPPVDALHRILIGLRQVARAVLGGKSS